MKRVFIDGSAGTTGLRIHERLVGRPELELIELDEQHRKDDAARAEALNAADVAFLCLPDEAAVRAADMVSAPDTVIIDTSTAHRTAEGWVYGFAELSGQREKIAGAKRIANPGCHASGFIALVAPLVEQGVLAPDVQLTCLSMTGYSGGGKKMIAQYEAADNTMALQAPRMYGLTQSHKHLPEMVKLCRLQNAPVFCPVVSCFYSGMEVVVPLSRRQVSVGVDELKARYRAYYGKGLVHYVDEDEAGFLSAGALANRDDMQVGVYGNDERILLVSRFDNLGKGASGAAIQNMNLVLGLDETAGLNVAEGV